MLNPKIGRRGFLASLGALLVVAPLPVAWAEDGKKEDGKKDGGDGKPRELNAFVSVAPDSQVTIWLPSSEMGQGVCTALAQFVAEELDADWSRIRVETGEDEAFQFKIAPGYKLQITGGSASVTTWGEPLRKAGAQARAMLVAAAAERWDVKAEACTTTEGVVKHPSGKQATYGELATEAANQKAPSKPTFKPVSERRFIGQSTPRNDLLAKVDGTAVFAGDIRIPGMLRACPLACPVFGGKVGKVDDKAARAIPGVRDVLVFDDFVAVVADTWWPARLGVAALDVTWQEGPNAGLNSAGISKALRDGLDDKEAEPAVGRKEGDAPKAIVEADGKNVLEAVYEVPYLDHAPMEPLNCTVHIQAERCDVWVGTQAQTMVVQAAAKATGLDEAQVFVHTTFLGGGFGRRGNNDWVEQALTIAKKVHATYEAPVQVQWTREEGIRHGFYLPAAVARMRAAGSKALEIRIASSNILRRYLPPFLLKTSLARNFPMEGFLETSPYVFPDVEVSWVDVNLAVPIGFWRSVGHSYAAFFMESFLDEIAAKEGKDPVELRRALLSPEHPRFRAVMDKAAEASGWGKAPAGHFQGIALHECFGSICAQVAEISMVDGLPKVHRITAAVDCGPVVNPDIVKAQIMGGALFGLSEALGAKLELKEGRIVQGNFHDYPLLRMAGCPEVDVHIVDTPGAPVGGIGEIGTPPAAPAVCNAIFAATGKRIRKLPILDALKETA